MNDRKISRGQVLAVIISKQQQRSLLFCASAFRNAKVHIQKVPIDVFLLVDECVINDL